MFSRKIIKVYDSNTDITKAKLAKLRSCSLNLIFYCEDIYIDRLFIPAVKKKWVGQMIKNNLIINFDDIGKLCYSYDILHKSANKYCISLYCINSKKYQLFDVLNNKVRVTGVYLIQFCYLFYIHRHLKLKNFLLVFNTNSYTYILSSLEGALIYCNMVISHQLALNYIINNIETTMKDIKDRLNTTDAIPVLFINYESKNNVKEISQLYQVKDLGNVSEDKLIRKYIGVL